MGKPSTANRLCGQKGRRVIRKPQGYVWRQSRLPSHRRQPETGVVDRVLTGAATLPPSRRVLCRVTLPLPTKSWGLFVPIPH